MDSEFLKRLVSSLILLPASIYIIIYDNLIFKLFLVICLIISLYEWHLMKKNKFLNISFLFFLLLTFILAYKLRYDFDENYTYFLITILVCVFTDIGGYIFGKIFKGPKLTKISPNKTYSGMIGSFLMSFLLCLILIYTKSVNEKYLINLIIFVFFVSTISQFGDILISYFKRLSNIKDTGRIIPGHGGVLDRIDGMIFAFPFSYVIFLFDYFNTIV